MEGFKLGAALDYLAFCLEPISLFIVDRGILVLADL